MLSQNHTSAMLEVYDLLGRKLMTLPIPSGKNIQTIYPQRWAAGLYLLRVTENGSAYNDLKIIYVK